jgi:hypothetical protein
VTQSELPFYNAVALYNKNITVALEPTQSTFVSTHAAYRPYSGYKTAQVIVSTSSDDADRFYVYKKTGQ